MEYYSTIKKNRLVPSATVWMDLEGIMLSEISLQITYDFTYMWHLKNHINKQTKQKQTHRYREQFDGCQRGGGLRDWMEKVKGLRSTDW